MHQKHHHDPSKQQKAKDGIRLYMKMNKWKKEKKKRPT